MHKSKHANTYVHTRTNSIYNYIDYHCAFLKKNIIDLVRKEE